MPCPLPVLVGLAGRQMGYAAAEKRFWALSHRRGQENHVVFANFRRGTGESETIFLLNQETVKTPPDHIFSRAGFFTKQRLSS